MTTDKNAEAAEHLRWLFDNGYLVGMAEFDAMDFIRERQYAEGKITLRIPLMGNGKMMLVGMLTEGDVPA